MLVGGELAAFARGDGGHHRVFVDVGRNGQRTDAELLQQHQASGGGGGEAHAHHPRVGGARVGERVRGERV
ncbi:hypothetical protein GCM10010461_27840 [Microbacterium aurantiacum]